MPPPNQYGVNASPVVDEWGIYDPDRAGLAAVLQRLEARGQSAYRNDPRTLVSSVRDVQTARIDRTTE